MDVWYVLLPGTDVSVSRGGSDFKPHALHRPVKFREPTVTTDVIFKMGNWQILVERSKVVVSSYDEQHGHNQWGE